MPFVVAAMRAVPLPANTGELIVVESVMAGVVVAVATLPAKPLAETTETEVTVPEPPARSTRSLWVVGSAYRAITVSPSASETAVRLGLVFAAISATPKLVHLSQHQFCKERS